MLRDYRESVGEEEFKRVFAQYLCPGEPAACGNRHRQAPPAHLGPEGSRPDQPRLAGQYFVEVDGRYLVDDVPNDERTSLRQVLEAYRSGKLPR